MDNGILCKHCGYRFTKVDIDGGDVYMALAVIDVVCPKCSEHEVMDCQEIIEAGYADDL